MKITRCLIAGMLAVMLLDEPAASESIQLVQSGGVFMLPVHINDAVVIPFILDSGAAEVVIPEDVFSVLRRSGTISQSDFVGSGKYRLADGSTTSSDRYIVHKMTIGTHIVTDVTANVTSAKSEPLLGQSFLQRLPGWSLDNSRHTLVLNDDAQASGEQPKTPMASSPPSGPGIASVPTAPAPSSSMAITLGELFGAEMRDIQVPFLESRLGVARRVVNLADEQRREYTVQGCSVIAEVKNNEIIGYNLFLGLNDPTKENCNLEIPTVDHLRTNGLTLGKFVKTMGLGLADSGKMFRAACFPFPLTCGNSADPAVFFRWVGYHAIGFLEIYLSAVPDNPETWQNMMIREQGNKYVNSKQFNCDGKYEKFGMELFHDSAIYEISIRSGGQAVEPFFAKLCDPR